MALALGSDVTVRKAVCISGLCRLLEAMKMFCAVRKLPREDEENLKLLMERRFGAGVWDDSSVDRLAPKLNIPALLFHDREDWEVPSHHSEVIARAWPGSRLVLTEGLGHRRILQDEQVIAQAVVFLQS
jgi:pimeloyl-ACP methyl ester carboxylesterase